MGTARGKGTHEARQPDPREGRTGLYPQSTEKPGQGHGRLVFGKDPSSCGHRFGLDSLMLYKAPSAWDRGDSQTSPPRPPTHRGVHLTPTGMGTLSKPLFRSPRSPHSPPPTRPRWPFWSLPLSCMTLKTSRLKIAVLANGRHFLLDQQISGFSFPCA